jgi:hypothetical protein
MCCFLIDHILALIGQYNNHTVIFASANKTEDESLLCKKAVQQQCHKNSSFPETIA